MALWEVVFTTPHHERHEVADAVLASLLRRLTGRAYPVCSHPDDRDTVG